MSGEVKHGTLTWREGLVFEGGAPGGPVTVIDGDNAEGPGPMLTLLLAAGACSGSDVVIILEKMRTPASALRVELSGERREEEPRRYVAVHLHFFITGDGIDEARASRAIDLSVAKYCSVIHSLAPDIRVTHDLTLG